MLVGEWHDIMTMRDYSERLDAQFNTETQSTNFEQGTTLAI